jgi:hypothetical protein
MPGKQFNIRHCGPLTRLQRELPVNLPQPEFDNLHTRAFQLQKLI